MPYNYGKIILRSKDILFYKVYHDMTNPISPETDILSVENQLMLLGIDEKTYLRLQPSVREALGKGSLTPLLDLKLNIGGNKVLEMPCKLQFVPDRFGNHQLMIYPVNHTLSNTTGLGNVSFNKLKQGELVIVQNAPFNREFIQLDRETNNFIRVKEKDLQIEEKLTEYEKVRDIQLGSEQKARIIEGKPVELLIGEEKVTVGLDLKSPGMFKELKGDMESWKRQKEIEYDIAHPEYLGPVQTEKNRWEFLIAQKQLQGLSQSKSINHSESKESPNLHQAKTKGALRI